MFRIAFILTTLALVAAPASGKDQQLAFRAREVLEKHCAECHGVTRQAGKFDVRVYETLLGSSRRGPYVTPKVLDKSFLWTKVVKDDMPPVKALDDADKKALREWIEAGAPAFGKPAAKSRPFVAIRDVLAVIRDHLRDADVEDRPYLRYFVLAHNHNDARLDDADLRLYRAALVKALNSMTWKKAIVLPQPLDRQGTVYGIDLRDLDWDKKPYDVTDLWTEMVRHYPYGLRYNETDDSATQKLDKDLFRLADHQLVYLRADWFVATATRPPLYHRLLRLPHTAGELERKLGVDIASNFRRNRLWRAGFSRSGVSGQNRLIERHDALYGAYWKSYDFKRDSARSNLLQLPLGPDFSAAYRGKYPYAEAAFRQDGGEIIFHLPNGLQGYMLVDGKDCRIDQGPTEVVFDKQKTSGGPEIVNGLSCIACHKDGMITDTFKDDIRHGASLSGAGRLKVRQLYPAPEVLARLMEQDRDVFRSALKKVVVPYIVGDLDGMAEPVGKWARAYIDDLRLEDVACELGFEKPGELKVVLRSNEVLRELGLGGLPSGGLIKRADWERRVGRSLYQRAAAALGLADSFNPR